MAGSIDIPHSLVQWERENVYDRLYIVLPHTIESLFIVLVFRLFCCHEFFFVGCTLRLKFFLSLSPFSHSRPFFSCVPWKTFTFVRHCVNNLSVSMKLRSACAFFQCNFITIHSGVLFCMCVPVNIGTKFNANVNRSLIGRLIKGFIELILFFCVMSIRWHFSSETKKTQFVSIRDKRKKNAQHVAIA